MIRSELQREVLDVHEISIRPMRSNRILYKPVSVIRRYRARRSIVVEVIEM